MGDHNQIATGLDRRTLIKRGAAAGAIAWTVPTILSSQAHAVSGACTPGCGGEARPTNLSAFIYCLNPGGKWVGVNFTVTGECNCVETAPRVVSIGVTNATVGGTALTQYGPGTAISGSNATVVLKKANGGGAVGDGVVTGVIAITVGCLDRTGDEVLTQCAGSFSFGWNPGNGNCGDAVNINPAATYTPSGCLVVGCIPAEAP